MAESQHSKLLSEVLALRLELQELRQRIDELRACTPTPENALRQRGFEILAANHLQPVLLPANVKHIPEYLRLLRRYSFRLFLRDVIQHRDRFTIEDLVHYCSASKAERYLESLREMGMVSSGDGTHWHLAAPAEVRSFGDTLEWYVAQLLIHEMAIPALWDVSLRGLQRGGDFDVIGTLHGGLLYLETKSSPPKNVHMDVINGFVRRTTVLQPGLSVLLMDTHLRMEDKVNKMVRAALCQAMNLEFPPNTEKLARGVFRLRRRLYTCNSKPDIRKNLLVCTRDYLATRSET